MKVVISGQNIHVKNYVQSHIREKLDCVLPKYLSDDAMSVQVHYANKHHLYECDIVIHEESTRNVTLTSKADSEDMLCAFDASLLKLETQLRKHKSKSLNKNAKIKPNHVIEEVEYITKYIFAPLQENANESEEQTPIIIAEMPTVVEKLSVSNACAKLESENANAIVFKNIKNNRINFVYYRKDGNIAWIDPK
jgi:ribosomal subunit interface protein